MTSSAQPEVAIPSELLPADGRFGCGPSKVRPEAVKALADAAKGPLGTSHRQAPVRNLVRRLRDGLFELFELPDGYEVILGNGGSTGFWDMAAFGLIHRQSQHLCFGEFSSKFATAVKDAPFLASPEIIESPAGTHPEAVGRAGIDLYALTHNETSTGVMMQIRRPEGAEADALVAVDGTSAAGGLRVDPEQFDIYYFAPQKGLASDGGIWLAAVSPTAIERIVTIKSSERWIPASLDLSIALDNSRLDQTYNTPAIATIILTVSQVEWMLEGGGMDFAAGRSERSAEILYGWAESSEWARPFVSKPDERSNVVGTIDFDDTIDAAKIAKILRANGIVDTEPYRKLGRNQLRVGMFPAVEPEDVSALTQCIDYVVNAIQ